MKTEYTSLEKGVHSKIWNFGSNNVDQSSTNFDLEMSIHLALFCVCTFTEQINSETKINFILQTAVFCKDLHP